MSAVGIAQLSGVVSVSCHAFEAKEQRGAQGDQIRLPPPKPAGVFLRLRCVHPGQHLVDALGERTNGPIVKIHVGQRDKETVCEQLRHLIRPPALPLARLGQTYQLVKERILQLRRLWLLPAHPKAS